MSGDLDLTNIRGFTAALEDVSIAPRAVIVSLARASSFDSRAVHALLLAGRRLATGRRPLLLVVPRAPVLRRILDATAASAAFPLFDAVDRAVAAAASPGHTPLPPGPLSG